MGYTHLLRGFGPRNSLRNLLALIVTGVLAIGASAATPGLRPAVPPSRDKVDDKTGDQGVKEPAAADDAELQALAKKLGQQFGKMSATLHRGPAQDSDVRVVVTGTKAEPVGGETPGAKVRLDLRVSEMQLQGGDFVDSNYTVDIDLRRTGDKGDKGGKWTCVKAMATPGQVSTKFGPEVGGAPREPINITRDVQRALVAIGAAESPAVALRAAVSKWVSDNNAFGPDAPIVEDMTGLAEKDLAANVNFGILLGAGLTKSHEATRVGVFNGQLYVVRYTDAQAKRAGLKPNNVVHSTEAAAEPRRVPPDAELGKPDFGDGPLELGTGVKATVPVHATRRLPQGEYVVRLSYSIGGQNFSFYHHLGGWLAEKDKAVECKFGAPTGEEAAKFAGPLVAFVDVCEMRDDGTGGQSVEVISPSAAVVLDVKGGGAAKP